MTFLDLSFSNMDPLVRINLYSIHNCLGPSRIMTSVVHRRGYNISSVQKKRARFTEPQKDKKEKKFVTTNVVFKTKPKPTKASSLGKKSGKIKSTLTSRRHYSRPPSPPPKKRLTLAAESNSTTIAELDHLLEPH